MAAEARGPDRGIISQFVMAFFPSITGQLEDFHSTVCSVLADHPLQKQDWDTQCTHPPIYGRSGFSPQLQVKEKARKLRYASLREKHFHS